MGGREPQISDPTAQDLPGEHHTHAREGPEVLDLLATHMREVRGRSWP